MSMENNLFPFDSEIEAKMVLQQEGKRLMDIAKKVWREYLESYKPEVYVRTGRSLRSIKLGKVKVLDGDTMGIELTFQDDLTYHDSYLGSDQPQGHAIMLISNGWRVSKGWHKNIYRFGYYEGFDYIGKVVEEFNSSKHRGITLEVQWSNKYTRR